MNTRAVRRMMNAISLPMLKKRTCQADMPARIDECLFELRHNRRVCRSACNITFNPSLNPSPLAQGGTFPLYEVEGAGGG